MYDILTQKWKIENTSCKRIMILSKIDVKVDSILAIPMPQSYETTIKD